MPRRVKIHENDILQLCVINLAAKIDKDLFSSLYLMEIDRDRLGGIMLDMIESLPGLNPWHGGFLKVGGDGRHGRQSRLVALNNVP